MTNFICEIDSLGQAADVATQQALVEKRRNEGWELLSVVAVNAVVTVSCGKPQTYLDPSLLYYWEKKVNSQPASKKAASKRTPMRTTPDRKVRTMPGKKKSSSSYKIIKHAS